MSITINGQVTAFEGPISVTTLLQALGYSDHFVAVAINQECILRKHYDTQLIQANDQLEILAPMAGG